MKWLRIAPIQFAFAYVGDPSQMHQGLTETDHQMLSLATSDYIAAGRSLVCEKQS